ncbi:MAG: type IV secretion system DNA-binding domain-containing protein [Candidatus Niyogibacteria bacterium]|nr:type IV secretion system DNA-binding domain-containing protein [Candidatus Niyogibacteria bacterium]
MEHDRNKIYFAETNFRNQRKRFGIKRHDRSKHVYIIGKTGMGKTTLLENMVIQDIKNGDGVGVVDPHGEFAQKMLDFVPRERARDVIYFNPSDLSFPMGFNIMENIDPDKRHLVAAGLMGVFKKIWVDVWSARMEYILGNTILALLEYPDSTLLSINHMLANKEFRKKVVAHISDPVVKSFWVDEFAKYTDRYTQEALPAIQNKVGQFISNPLIRNIVGQKKSSFDMRKIMDERKILIMNLSKGKVGEENSRLLGAMLITRLYLAAMSRVEISHEKDRPDFYLYVDEFQNFASESFANILSEARKYHLNLILAHQYITQMDESVRDAVFGNVGTMISFRIGAADAEFLEKEFSPEFMLQDIVNLGFARIYLKLMIDGVTSRPFSATTLPPIEHRGQTFRDEIFDASRDQFGRSRKEIEDIINESILEKPDFANASTGKPDFANASHFAEASRDKPTSNEKSFQNQQTRTDSASSGITVYQAICDVCGQNTLVPFIPDGKRPVYCKAHRKERIPSPTPIRQTPERPSYRATGAPSIRQGEHAVRYPQQEVKTISLKDLKRNTPEPAPKGPDVEGLRRALKESMEEATPNPLDESQDKKQNENPHAKMSEAEKNGREAANKEQKIIRPGDTIRF